MIDPEQVSELFHRLEPLDPTARAELLDKECAGRSELRAEVEELLDALPEGEAMFGKPPIGVAPMFDSLQGYLLKGRQLGPYIIEEALPGGAMGLVVRARDTRTGEAVALKLLAPELAGEPQWQRRFAREAAALRALNDPAVVKLIESGEDQGFSYFTMELIDGENLRQRMARARPSLAESLAWVKGILKALEAAHAAGFTHGDLKPENIMLDSHGQIRLLDFGLTRPIAPNIPATQTASVVTGTIQYLSPERIAGADVDARSDLFSVGVLLHEFLAGSTPFARSNPLATAAAILHEPSAELPAGSPAGLAALVKQCLEKDPARRPASALALSAEIDQAISPHRTSRVPWVAAAVVILAILAFAAWRMWSGSAAPVRVTVPGTTDIWLARQPDGAEVTGMFGTDSAPRHSPVPVPAIAGHVLTISASGKISVDGDCYAASPDGGCYPDSSQFGAGPLNGVGQFRGPTGALIGVFLGANAPTPESIDFRHFQNFPALAPKLNQVFFIGDGLTGTGNGKRQRFTVPAGATRLYLAASDSLGSAANNAGQFTVDVTDLGAR
jgi:serine/threonine protein kinase